MITFSAFADEIGAELDLQMDICEANGVKWIDVRGIDGVNVSKMTVAQAAEYKKRMDDRGFAAQCVGSPLGKISMDDDFDEHLDLLKHCGEVGKALGTSRIRMFSFYPSEGKSIQDQRDEVMARLSAMVAVAEADDLVLLHENESNIYGATPNGVKDIFATIASDRLLSIFDPGNYVTEGLNPYEDAWCGGLAELTESFHIKDRVRATGDHVPAGDGDGQFAKIFADLKKRNWSGFMSLEPHMASAGQFSGFTGPDLFAKAAAGLKRVCEQAGLDWQ